MKQKILIVEDQFIEANNLQLILERAGYVVSGIAFSVPKALKMVQEDKPDLVLLDIFLQGPLTGIDLAKTLKEKNIAFVYLSANSNKETLEAAKATYPYGFLVKPFREKDVLVMLEIARYLHEHSLESVIRKSPSKNNLTDAFPRATLKLSTQTSHGNNFHGIVGKSKKLLTVLDYLKMVAPSDTAVLIQGESGTGKELFAQCIYEISSRNTMPFIKINCAALPANLIESTLFGHERGAFTSASERKIGKFEQADKGTLLLDEVCEMPLDIQVKLLRILQEKEFERVGGNETKKVDVRIIATTNRNFEKEVAEGRFRIDLYYRLNVFPLHLPALREGEEDIALLANYFNEVYSKKTNRAVETVPPSVIKILELYNWPGNVRELENVIERALLIGGISHINKNDFPAFTGNAKTQLTKLKTMEENERDHIVIVLKKCHGKIFGRGGAAEILGMNPSTLNSRIKKLGIDKELFEVD